MNHDLDLARTFWDTARRIRARLKTTDPSSAQAAPTVALTPDVERALEQLDTIRDDCRRLVLRRASLSAGVAVVPLPGLDVGTDIAILLKLLPRINERFGLTPQQIEALDPETKRVVLMFVGSVGSTLVGRLITRDLVMKVLMKMGVRVTTKGIVKFVPLIGQAVSASISFGAMKILGDRHVDDCYRVARQALLERRSDGPAPDASWVVVP